MSEKPQSREPDMHKEKETSSSSGSSAAAQVDPGSSLRLIAPLDILTVIGLVVLTPVAWLLPQHLWQKLGRSVIEMVTRLLPNTAATTAARIDSFLGPASDRLSTHEIIKRALSRYYEETLLLLKCYRPDGWEPVVELQGLEHMRAAVSSGKGVVLWIGHFQHYSLISKIAMFRAGFPFSHLSHPRHGFSSTRFGMRFLNPIRTHVEDRYLKERVYMGLDESKTAVNTLRERLLVAGVISITARGDKVHKPVSVPFLTGTLPLAIGAPGLAQQTQATLLPVHTVQLDSGAYAVIIEPPIVLEASQTRWAAGEAAAREYASRLETVVREFPDQWEGWGYVVTGISSKRNEN